jgi:hypothetical protein
MVGRVHEEGGIVVLTQERWRCVAIGGGTRKREERHYRNLRLCRVCHIHGSVTFEHGRPSTVYRHTAETLRYRQRRQNDSAVCPAPRDTADGLPCVSRPAWHSKGASSSDARQGWIQRLPCVCPDTAHVCCVLCIYRVSPIDLHIPVVGPIFTVYLIYRVSFHGTVNIWSTRATPRSTGERHVSPLSCACTRQRTFVPFAMCLHTVKVQFFHFLFVPHIPAIQTIYAYMVAIHK